MSSQDEYQILKWIDKVRFKRLSKIAWPITWGMLAANINTLVDTAMVGRLGDEALGGVAIGGTVSNLLFSTVMGLSMAVQAITSRRVGEGNNDRVANALHAGLFLALIAGGIMAVVGVFLSPSLLGLLPTSEEVYKMGLPYLQTVALAVPALGFNASFRGFFNGLTQTTIYMRTLIFSVCVNLILDYVLIFGHLGFPALGTLGAGIATTVSIYSASLIYLYFAYKVGRPYGFGLVIPKMETVRAVLKLAIPTLTGQMLTSIGGVTYFAIIAAVGDKELAATTICFRLGVVLVLPSFGFGMAAAALAGQSLGKGDPNDARHWGYDTVKLGSALMSVLGLPLIFIPHLIARLFITDPETIELALWPMRLLGITMGFNGCSLIFGQLLNGCGDQKFMLKATSGYQWLVGLPFIATVALVLDWGLTWIWAAQVTNYFMICNILWWRWRGDGWTKGKF